MKLKSVFSRIPKWLILLVILAAFYFIFRKSVEGFTLCYSYYEKNKSGFCKSGIVSSPTKPTSNFYNNSRCYGGTGFRTNYTTNC